MTENNDKIRLDVLLVEKQLFETRQKAQAAIMAGLVLVNDKQETKSGTKLLPDVKIEVKGNACPYVSRGGLKLECAIKDFNLNVKNLVCIDAGASSGGFTDCLLQNGAAYVYAVDVGYGQIDWKLRNDQRVKVIERTNIRYLEQDKLYEDSTKSPATFCTADLSFISVEKVLANILKLMNNEGSFVILIKPQFEAGKHQVPKTGVVKDKKVHFEVIKRIFNFCSTLNLIAEQLTYSPVKGPSGNIEYLCYITNNTNLIELNDDYIMQIVEKAHQELK